MYICGVGRCVHLLESSALASADMMLPRLLSCNPPGGSSILGAAINQHISLRGGLLHVSDQSASGLKLCMSLFVASWSCGSSLGGMGHGVRSWLMQQQAHNAG